MTVGDEDLRGRSEGNDEMMGLGLMYYDDFYDYIGYLMLRFSE